MAYKITDACVACGACISECPVEAISEGDIYVIESRQMHGMRCMCCRMSRGSSPTTVITAENKCSSSRMKGIFSYKKSKNNFGEKPQ
jgi:ferredoxin